MTYAPLVVGTNSGEVVIYSNDEDEPEIHVVLSGRGILDYLQVFPATGLVSRGHPGGPFTPESATYVLTNNSGSAINWTAENTQSWVTLSQASGSLAIGQAQSVTVTVNAAANALAEGVHADVVTFSNVTTGIRHVPVNLTVFTSPQMVVSPTSMSVTNRIGQSQTNIMTVSNAGTADGNSTFRLSSRNREIPPFRWQARRLSVASNPGHDFTQVEPGREIVPGELLVRFADGVVGTRATR